MGERETAAMERAGLEMKQLHSSQSVARDLTRLSVQIQLLGSSIHTADKGVYVGEECGMVSVSLRV